MLSELDNYRERIDDLRRQVCELITDLPAEALNWRPIPPLSGGTNSLAVLATHIAGAEHFWIAEVIGGRPPTRDRDAEFTAQAGDAAELCRWLEATGAETAEVFSTLSAADLDGVREARGRTVPVRWAILHVVDHTAPGAHAAHAPVVEGRAERPVAVLV